MTEVLVRTTTDGPGERRLRAAVLAHGDRLRRVLCRRGLGGADAEDVIQDAFTVLARRLADVPEHNERAFLVGTSLRMASALKRSAWHARVTEAWDPDQEPLPEHLRLLAPEARDLYSLLPGVLDALPEEERSVFVLGELEEMSRQEVARTLSLPEGTVATRLARARSSFEKSLRRAVRASEHGAGAAPRNASAWPWETRLLGLNRYENNHFGADRARGHYEQRLRTRRGPGGVEVGWTWRWPGLDVLPFAFPEVVCGWKPWTGGSPTDPRFPVRISTIRRFWLRYAAEMFALGSYNLSADLWLMARGGWTEGANPARITSEVMIIVEQTLGARPPGRLLSHVVIEGARYELWRAGAFGGELRAGRAWQLLSFRAPGPRPHGTLDLKAFLAHLARAGLVHPEEYVASVELGNEIRGGAGTTFIADFDVELET